MMIRLLSHPPAASLRALFAALALPLLSVGCAGPAPAEADASAETMGQEIAPIGPWKLDADRTYEANAEEILAAQDLTESEIEASRAMLRQLFSQMDNRLELFSDGRLVASQRALGTESAPERIEGTWSFRNGSIDLVLADSAGSQEKNSAQLVGDTLRVVTEASPEQRLTLVFVRDL